MNEYDLINAVGDIDPELVEGASDMKPVKRPRRYLAAFAAALAGAAVLAVGLGVLLNGKGTGTEDPESRGVSPETATELPGVQAAAPTERTMYETTEDPRQMSYIGFIKYRDCNYFFYQNVFGAPELVGERLGSIETTVKPGTPLEDWPDMSSYEKGDFYAVNGFDPAFMICRTSRGFVSIFISRSECGHMTPEEILEGVWHASDYLSSVRYEGSESRFHGYDEVFELDPDCLPAVLDLIAVLDGGEWFGPIGDDAERLAILNGDQWKLTLFLGKIELRITVYEGGYASIPCGGDRFVRFDKEKLSPLWELLSSGEHGEPVPSMESMRSIRPEKLHDDPYYGGYFPVEPPEGYYIESVFVYYPTDEDSGRVISDVPSGISVEYRGIGDRNRMIRISVSGIPSMADFLEELRALDGWRCHAPLESVSADTVKCLAPEYPDDYEVMAYDENVSIRIFAMNSLVPDEIIALMHECFGK